ncbi:MAG: riboflavin synthase [candidate division Zixibacteria bacterium]|nr:riboflavin synthase [candidate division Zixibacteria bacterium]MCI0595414.1 riboflavin synthase [candidate division Zixibacteria bacterium]
MFTGLVTDVGKVALVSQTKEGKELLIEARKTVRELKKGDSVSINGACQTVVSKNGAKFAVLAIPETLRRTNFDKIQTGSRVNLELPLRLSDRLGGHFVTGHIDTQARLLEVLERKGSVEWWVELPREFAGLVIEKGSVALDGVSLTVAGLKPGRFKAALIPHTLKATTLGERKVGDFLNVEFDFLGKYVHQVVRARHASPLRKKRGQDEI